MASNTTMTWKKYGGISKQDNLNSLSVHSFSTGLFTMRDAYYGAFDINGELHVTSDIKSDSNIYGNFLTIKRDISANRIFTQELKSYKADISGNLVVSDGNTFLRQNLNVDGVINLKNQLFLGNSPNVYIVGIATGNIGINTVNPVAALDINSSNQLAFKAGTATLPFVRSIPIQNMNNQGIVLSSNINDSKLGFFVDSSIQTGTPDGLIQYSRGGYLTIDVSKNTNILSAVGISSRGNPQHILNETVIVYDNTSSSSSSQPFLKEVYGNVNETKGDALTLVADGNAAITFLNIITPGNTGLSIGGGVYPLDQKRAMGTIGWLDSSANYIPSINIVAGNSNIRKKTTVGINTHSPSTESYAFDVNGPVHLKNGELTMIKRANFQVLSLGVGKASAFAVGTPVDVVATNETDSLFNLQFLKTVNGGETWNYVEDISGGFMASEGVSIRTVYTHDSDLTIIAGGLYAYYSKSNSVFDSLDFNGELAGNINSVYIQTKTSSTNRAFFGLQNGVYWIDLSMNMANLEITSRGAFAGNIEITAMDGYESMLWMISGNAICSVENPLTSSPSVSTSHSANMVYNTIRALDSNNVIASGSKLITYTKNGGNTWNNVYFPNYRIRSVGVVDSSNAIAVCNSGAILYSTDGYSSWNPVPQNIINCSGNADRLTDPNYDLTAIGVVDINNFYITKQIQSYSSLVSKGITEIHHAYLPGLFNTTNNFVLDISGSAKISGDIMIVDGGRLESSNPVFSLLNNNVAQIDFGKSASNIFIGNTSANSSVILNRDLTVLNNSVLNGNLTVQQTTFLKNELYVDLNATFNANVLVNKETIANSNLFVMQNANVKGEMYVGGNTTLASNLNVLKDSNVSGEFYVVGNTTLASNLNVLKDSNVSGAFYVVGNTTLASNLNVLKNANISEQLFVGNTVYSANARISTLLFTSNLLATTATVGNLQVNNGNIANLVSANLTATGNARFNRNITVVGSAFMQSDATIYGNATIGTDLNVSGNIIARQNIHSSVFEGELINLGGYSADFSIGGYSYPGTNITSRSIKIGNHDEANNPVINTITIGGSLDNIIIGGNLEAKQDIKLSKTIQLNTPIINNGQLEGDNSSAGSGLYIADGETVDAGSILGSADKSGYIFTSANSIVEDPNKNKILFDVKNSTLQNTTTGLMTLVSSSSSSDDFNYKMIASSINPDSIVFANLLLTNKPNSKVVDSEFSVVGHMSVGGLPTQTNANCSLELHGNLCMSNGLIIQF